MKLTEGHERMLIRTCKSIPAKIRCLFCEHTQLDICSVIDTTEYNDGVPAALIQGAGHIPFIQLVCQRCGYAHLFNAIKIGAVDQSTGVLKEEA